MPYVTGVALKYGRIALEYFDDPHLHDETLLELVSRIKCEESEEANKREPEAMLCDLTMTLSNGARHDIRVEHHRGHPRNPMPDAEIEEKFRELAGEQMTKAQCDALLARLWALDQMKDMGELFALTRI